MTEILCVLPDRYQYSEVRTVASPRRVRECHHAVG
jgi:hypothetical protein